MVPTNRSVFFLVSLAVIGLFVACPDWCLNKSAAQPAPTQTEDQPEKSLPEIPPLPEGTPEELMDFVKELKKNNVRPSSRQEMIPHLPDCLSMTKVPVQRERG